MKGISLTKAERLARTSGLKGWIAMFTLLGIMCYDQFILEIPFANVVFPILIICAASMNPAKNAVLIIAYSIIFELSCIAWFPSELYRVQWWLLEVAIGYSMPLVCYNVFNRKHEDMSVFSYASFRACVLLGFRRRNSAYLESTFRSVLPLGYSLRTGRLPRNVCVRASGCSNLQTYDQGTCHRTKRKTPRARSSNLNLKTYLIKNGLDFQARFFNFAF